jgi:hypothetical protein
VPCYDPTSADPNAQTGACQLGCDEPNEPPVHIGCGWNGPPVLDPNTLPDCSPTCGGAHCLPAALVPEGERDQLATCPGGYCAPDGIIATDGFYKPPSCTSLAGAEGRCLSTCLPQVASQPLLPRSSCAANERCVPCFDPTNGDVDTKACEISSCDEPNQPAVMLHCPWTGPPVIDPNSLPGCCAGSHCLPAAYVPPGQRGLLATCNRGAGYCTPDDIIRTDNNWVPSSCTSIAGAEGRCLSTCLPEVSGQPLLPQSSCAANERCVPCYDPTSSNPDLQTGACGLGCDFPHQPATHITCPWNGKPPVIDPNLLPWCCQYGSAAAHCLPSQYVPPSDSGLLAGCPGGSCTPDELIVTAGQYIPQTCRAFAGEPAEGRCLSRCLPIVSQNGSLETDNCGDERCAPCTDPCTGAQTGACTISSCDQPNWGSSPYTFSNCCGYNGRPQGKCIPKSQIPSGSQGNLEQNNCNGAELCIPYENLPAGSSCRPNGWWTNSPGCTVQTCFFGVCVTLYHGTCYSNCLNIGIGSLFPACIDGNHSCVPNF